jgi:hypothetical protein
MPLPSPADSYRAISLNIVITVTKHGKYLPAGVCNRYNTNYYNLTGASRSRPQLPDNLYNKNRSKIHIGSAKENCCTSYYKSNELFFNYQNVNQMF